MRLFIATDISEELREEAKNILNKIDFKASKVPVKNLHITLKFLGEVENTKKIEHQLKNIEFQEFFITSKNLGFFPNEQNIKVFWIGFEENQLLLNLHRKISASLPDLKDDFKYSPHLTIARINYLDAKNKNRLLKIKEKGIKKTTFKVSSFKLMKSTLTSKGSVYEVLKTFKAKAL
ncbi:MAG: RNA 2',3'-cyclic phosphodiesterase [archaeon]